MLNMKDRLNSRPSFTTTWYTVIILHKTHTNQQGQLQVYKCTQEPGYQ